MQKPVIFTWATLVSASLLAIGCGGSSGGGGESLANVNNEPITVDQFNAYLAIKPTVRVVIQGQPMELPVADTLAFQAMQDLVSRQVLMQMAKDDSLMPGEADVEKEITFQKALNTNFIRNYQARGMSMGQIRDEIRFNLAQERLVTKGIKISDSTVDDWIKKNPQAFVEPATVTLSFVLGADADKAGIDKALASGKSFRDVATTMSKAPNARATQGRFKGGQPVPVPELAPALRKEIEKTEPLSTTAWIQFPEGWAKFYVESKTSEVKKDITAERRENVRRALAIQQGNQANDLRKNLIERVRKSKITVERDSLKESWKRFEEMLKSQAEATADTATKGSTTGSSSETGSVRQGEGQ